MEHFNTDVLIAAGTTIVFAAFPIYVGSLLSLQYQKDAESGKPGSAKQEAMSKQDAYMFPLIGSCVLFGLYMLFRLFSKEYINMLLSAYFMLFGFGATTATFSVLFSYLIPVKAGNNKFIDTAIGLPFQKEKLEIKLSYFDILGAISSLALSLWYFQEKHWIASNIFGFSFSIQGVALVSLGSYSVGCLLLTGLFFYDIFWVFFTDVMVTVAKSFEAPIKLLIPKDFFASEYQFSMLGLGDIVIPGIFIALLLRFDYKRSKKHAFSKIYFNTTMLGYVLGLATTIFVMHYFQHPQPALLYLVPFCMGFSFFTAVVRGEISQLLDYQEGGEEEKKQEKAQ